MSSTRRTWSGDAARRVRVVAALAIAWLGAWLRAPPLSAQVVWFPSVDVHGAARADLGGPVARSLVLAPAAALRSRLATASLRATGDLMASRVTLGSADLEGAAVLWRSRPGALVIDGRGSYDAMQERSGRLWRADARLVFRRGAAERGAAAGVQMLAAGAGSSAFTIAAGRGSAWIRRGWMVLSAEVLAARLPALATFIVRSDSTRSRPSGSSQRAPSDTGTGRTPPTPPPQQPPSNSTPRRRVLSEPAALMSEVRVAMAARLASIDFDGTGGLVLVSGRRAQGWGMFTAAHWVHDRIAVVGGGDIRPLNLQLVRAGDVRPSPFAVLGVRLAPVRRPVLASPELPPPAAAALRATRVGEHVTLELSVPAGSRVELAGDFTQWEPVELRRVGGERWRTTLRLMPGVYRAHVRVDGGPWEPPPGVARVRDPYQGAVGLLVIE